MHKEKEKEEGLGGGLRQATVYTSSGCLSGQEVVQSRAKAGAPRSQSDAPNPINCVCWRSSAFIFWGQTYSGCIPLLTDAFPGGELWRSQSYPRSRRWTAQTMRPL